MSVPLVPHPLLLLAMLAGATPLLLLAVLLVQHPLLLLLAVHSVLSGVRMKLVPIGSPGVCRDLMAPPQPMI
jgi:hypothetical protein